ncbi:uncharacterized protein SCHCODRAFT_02627784 [Schizophyllum commune H4-8]|uniref:uncharacterized protein n=1 Tax=Schizophyllum commune (strain H4-8 / FGSC 9210) TaxID=578458 RepID=UPI00215F6291|nr:uncharacterized protein SCHCODRAFT_02627784 [Schizophyllum commune H4-8]KAI5890973.1 hypothetical protein SCHCODRAFT_02627784 [Schizophyllum commune H4-8]
MCARVPKITRPRGSRPSGVWRRGRSAEGSPAVEYPAWPTGVLRYEDRRITLWLARDLRKRQLERNPGGEQLMTLHSRHQRCCEVGTTLRRRSRRRPSCSASTASTASSGLERGRRPALW